MDSKKNQWLNKEKKYDDFITNLNLRGKRKKGLYLVFKPWLVEWVWHIDAPIFMAHICVTQQWKKLERERESKLNMSTMISICRQREENLIHCIKYWKTTNSCTIILYKHIPIVGNLNVSYLGYNLQESILYFILSTIY